MLDKLILIVVMVKLILIPIDKFEECKIGRPNVKVMPRTR